MQKPVAYGRSKRLDRMTAWVGEAFGVDLDTAKWPNRIGRSVVKCVLPILLSGWSITVAIRGFSEGGLTIIWGGMALVLAAIALLWGVLLVRAYMLLPPLSSPKRGSENADGTYSEEQKDGSSRPITVNSRRDTPDCE